MIPTIFQIVNPQTGQPMTALSIQSFDAAKGAAQALTNATGLVLTVLKIEPVYTTIAISAPPAGGTLKI